MLDEIAAQDRVDGCGPLKETAHSAHAVKERPCEPLVAEQMIVQEVQMTAGQAFDLGQRRVDTLRVERSTSRKECVLVAEVAMLRAPACYHDRVRDEVAAAFDEVAPDGRDAIERSTRH